jgi:hypothetical protein
MTSCHWRGFEFWRSKKKYVTEKLFWRSCFGSMRGLPKGLLKENVQRAKKEERAEKEKRTSIEKAKKEQKRAET